MAWQTPKTDWAVNPKNPVPEDFNRIEGNIDFLKGDIETKKGAIVNALNTVGLETNITDTHAQIASKITSANQGTKIYTPSTVNQTIPKGFHSGQGYVKGDSNLISSNIKKGVSIFGVTGNFITNVIKSVQTGYMAAVPTRETTISINAVNTNSSILLVEPLYSYARSPSTCFYRAELSSTSIIIGLELYDTPGVYRNYSYYVWKVIEFNPDVIKSKQQGTIEVNSTPVDISINTVNPSKTVVIVQGFRAQRDSTSGNYPIYYGTGGYLTSGTNLRFEVGVSAMRTAIWQLIEFV